jgi:hypothetical protein
MNSITSAIRSVLQEIADASVLRRVQLAGVALPDVLRERKQGDVRPAAPDLKRRAQALVAEAGRHHT